MDEIAEIEFTTSDYEEMMYPIYAAPFSKSILKEIPDLNQFREYQNDVGSLSRTKVIKYIGFCYDRKSPLVKSVDNLFRRKVFSAKLARFKVDKNGSFDNPVIEMLKGENREINEMIIRYCRNQKPKIYSLIVAGNEAYYEIIAQLHQKKVDKSGSVLDEGELKSKLFDKADSMIRKIDVLVDELLTNDKAQELESDLFKAVDLEDASMRLAPENITSKLL